MHVKTNRILSYLTLTILCVSLSHCKEAGIIEGEEGIKEVHLTPTEKPNEVINEKLFDVINLDYPGLEKVKSYHDNGQLYYAAHELLQYYRQRLDVINPGVNLLNPTITDFDLNVADQALAYRFYVRNFREDVVDGKEVYYLFTQNNAINWELAPAGITDQEFGLQMHRHQWMLPQAKAYRITKNEDYVKSWIEVYADWLKNHPVPEGSVTRSNPAWYALQPAERVISQVDLFYYFMHSAHFTPEWLSVFLTAFYDTVETIRNNYYTDGSNIYVTQTQAVITAGILLPEFKKSPEWLNEGAGKITEQVVAQFLEDGVQNELDPSYHIGVIADFYTIYKLAGSNNKLNLFPGEYIENLRKATRFVMDVIYPDYSIDNFNDTRSSSYTKSVLLRNLRQYSEMFPEDEEIQWMATEGKMGKKPVDRIQTYPHAGYYMMRSDWGSNSTVMILKNNYNPQNKWHCQPDNGTFGLYSKGRNFTPDAGVYSYGGTPESNADRRAFRATKMHNTMTRNSRDIADGYMLGTFLKQESNDNYDLIVTENKSYSDLTHRRAVFFVEKSFFVIVDEGYGENADPLVNVNFNLSPKRDDVIIDDRASEFIYGAHTQYGDNNNMLFKTFVGTTPGYAALNNTAYVSNKLGEKSAQRRFYQVTIKKPLNGAARFITVIHPFTTEADYANMDISARFTDNTEGLFNSRGASAEVTINGKPYALNYTLQ
ncbi:heparin-sulfate lyase HepC [Proteiniphilum sp. UBA1028]|jgi:heparan-sulfate lyase|uniref:heparin-sulfate lyase HepC n=1 Tax=Proteiniphilum sp. UBA1028 TaxID=1947251 RepID=UPI0025E84915|nr:heparin-sulfate lyase HepC [Proteiniphilum sp. UBA1028]